MLHDNAKAAAFATHPWLGTIQTSCDKKCRHEGSEAPPPPFLHRVVVVRTRAQRPHLGTSTRSALSAIRQGLGLLRILVFWSSHVPKLLLSACHKESTNKSCWRVKEEIPHLQPCKWRAAQFFWQPGLLVFLYFIIRFAHLW